jgi:hypothetical protein
VTSRSAAASRRVQHGGPYTTIPGITHISVALERTAWFDPPKSVEQFMARIQILKKDGTPTRYFWSDKDGADRTRQTVYKQAPEGVKRMRGVHFDAVAKRMHKH